MNFPPEWHALGREADLAAEQLAIGVTMLGRASHAQKGQYNQAFFALSIGLERLAKLIIVADHCVATNGTWLTDQDLKKKGGTSGHDISALLGACEEISQRHVSSEAWGKRPSSSIHSAIVSRLSEFASLTRYYNLASLSGGRAANSVEPIAGWWMEVGAPILDLHYHESDRKRDKENAAVWHEALANSSTLLSFDESEKRIESIDALMQHGAASRVVQRYGRLYTMQIIRWLSCTLHEISHKGAYVKRIDALLGLHERFGIFMNDDKYLRTRHTWSIYRLGR